MLQEGQPDAALQVIESVRARHDGARRNPFDEPEYGHHYARAMAAWGAVVAAAGFGYSAVRGEMRFAAAPGTVFWSNGSAWGTCTRTPDDHGWSVRLDVLGGEVHLRALELINVGMRRDWPPRGSVGARRLLDAGFRVGPPIRIHSVG